jgi:hypothetical protein
MTSKKWLFGKPEIPKKKNRRNPSADSGDRNTNPRLTLSRSRHGPALGNAYMPLKREVVKLKWEADMAKKVYTPGQKAPASGQYKNPGTGKEVTVVKGEPLPPTPKSGQGYVLVDKTKHK